jgi:hypothetical protein
MLNRRQTIVIALFAVLVGGIAWLDRHSSEIPSPTVHQNSAEKAHPKNNNQSYFYDVWEWTTRDAITVYTFFLAVFTAVLSGTAIVQIRFLRRADETARISAEAAKSAANTAAEGNTLTREIFVAEHRPWLIWRFPQTSSIVKIGDQLNIRIDAEIENIGKTPALNVTYFGRLYFPEKNEAILDQGIRFYAEHLHQAMQYQFALANVLPTEKIPISFGPHGIKVGDLPADRDFVLCLAFHAKYEFSGRLKQVAEIGAVYMVKPVGAAKITFHNGAFRGTHTSVTLEEYPGVRRIT